MSPVDLADVCIPPTASIRDALGCIDRNSKGIVLVVDPDRRLIDTVTDGDIRRAVLMGSELDRPISTLLQDKAERRGTHPVTAVAGTAELDLLSLMKQHSVRQIPVVSLDGVVCDVVTLDELVPNERLPLQAVIVAGGQGTRLHPLTLDTPKPMLPVGNRPLMELTVERLRQAGVRRVNVTTCHQADKIREHFGDGRNFGVEFAYVDELMPLGTAGGISLVSAWDEPLLVMNGDVLTRLDVRAMLDYHRDHAADLTVAVRKYDLKVPYGVVEAEHLNVKRIVEKPTYSFFVNAGIYLLEPSVRKWFVSGEPLQMTDLIDRVVDGGGRVIHFPVIEYWLDIGESHQYEQAQQDAKRELAQS